MTVRLKSLAVTLFLALWFVGQTWRALLAGFTEDDLMNMYAAWMLPLPKLLIGNLTPFTAVYRPFGSVFYRLMYDAVGLNPVPFRVAAYSLLLLNIWLVYRVIRSLTGSAEIAVLSALLFSYHKRLFGLWVNGGTIYDILCFTFFCLALWLYVSLRKVRGNVAGWGLLALCALYTLALNSKEMAAGLPVILLAYELIYEWPARNGWARWVYDRRAIWIAAAMTVVAFKFRQTKESSFHGIPDYDLIISVKRYFETTVPLVSQVFFLAEDAFTPATVLAFFALLWALAFALRNRALMLGAAIIMLAPLPINFITYRGFFVMYLPMLGWSLYFAAALVVLKDWIASRWPRLAHFNVALLLATAAFLFVVERRDEVWNFSIVDVKQTLIRGMRTDLLRIRPAMQEHGRVLLLTHAFEPDSFVPMYVVRLLYHAPDIAVDCAQSSRAPRPVKLENYHLVLAYCGQHYVEVNQSVCPATK
ncbi:MAG TPA: hypothetical protein VKR43_06305 [Bryobacteraceae bacterium]|nr:hypothetical protein [Bryobacteraceae bacterium]